jgi:hypothetical protein
MFMCVNSCSHTKQNIATGDTIIKKIELYKSENGVLPNSLQDIKQNEIINNVLFCYEKIDSVSYMVWFGTTLGEGVYYYSDTQQWEDRLRKMKE